MEPILKQRFLELRRDLFKAIERELEEDGHHKGYEGAFEIVTCYPNYFEQDEEPTYVIALHCYVVGPDRHYDWFGETLEVALNKAEHDIRKWIAEEYGGEFFYE